MRANRSPTAFVELSQDLILCVLCHLQPVDIIVLRRVCRFLNHLSRLRTVWTHALRNVMAQHTIPKTVFPIEMMPLSLLEHAALAPHKLVSILQQSNGGSMEPVAIRLLPPRLSDGERKRFGIIQNSGFYDTHIEDTGRYLVSLSAYESFTLFTVWDLGLCGNDLMKPLARYVEQATQTLYLDGFSAAPHSQDIFHIVSTQDSSFLLPLTILVHKAILSEPCQVTFLAKLEIPTDPFIVPDIKQIPGTCKVMVHYDDGDGSKFFWVWDFQNDLVAVLVVGDCQFTGQESTFCYDDCIMIASEGLIRIYNIPALKPLHSVAIPSDRQSAVIVTAPSQKRGSFVVASSIHRDATPYLLNVSPNELLLIEARDNSWSNDAKLPNKLPISVGSLSVDDNAFRIFDERLSISFSWLDDHIFLQGYNDQDPQSEGLSLFMTEIGKMRTNPQGTEFVKITLPSPLNRWQDIKKVHFSPILGRLYVHIRHRAAHHPTTHCVYILDYLVPPKER